MEKLRLEIDPHKLEEEWQSHPSMYGYWAEKAVEAQAEHDEIKSKIDVLKAELDKEIRDNPSTFGIDKLTETVIANTILLQPEHQALVKKLNEKKKSVGMARAALDALEHRKRALSLMVELWIRDYYSDQHRKSHSETLTDDEKKAVRRRGRDRERDTDAG